MTAGGPARLVRRAASWGTRPEEEALSLPCDALLGDEAVVLHRAVDVSAPVPLLFRWLCQLRAAPYSYDLIDNGGRRSPQELTAGLEALEPGQRVMGIFRLVGFEPGTSLTARHRGRVFGQVVVTYAARPGPAGSRLLLRIRWAPARVPVAGRALVTALVFGDLVMARRQLLNLKALAERDAARTGGAPPRAAPGG
jgi:hypothetical protein